VLETFTENQVGANEDRFVLFRIGAIFWGAANQPTKAVLEQTCMGVVFIPSVSETIFAIIFLPKRPWTTYVPRITLWQTLVQYKLILLLIFVYFLLVAGR
jgi:hypothetical protein